MLWKRGIYMIAELVAVGTEILLGNIVNTNSAYLSEKCAQLGLSVYYESVVGDNRDRMKAVIASALDRSDVVILSGYAVFSGVFFHHRLMFQDLCGQVHTRYP